MDTWWQTETGMNMITPLPCAPLKAGSACKPFPGIIADVVDKKGKRVQTGKGGYLVIKNQWPSMIRTIFNNPKRYIKTYWSQIKGMYFAGDVAFRDKDGYHLHTGDNKSQWGGLHEFKLVIRPALDTPIEQVHPLASTRWTHPFPVTLRVNFGEVAVEGYVNCSLASGDAAASASWADPSLLKLETDDRFAETAPVRLEGVSPKDAATQPPSALRLRLERDGYYLVSLLVGSAGRAVGPCEVYGGVGEPRKAPQVAAGEYGSWPIVGHAVDGVLEVTLRGDFRLVAASAAALMYENEDYLIGRGWWLSTEFHEGDHLPR